MKRALPLLLLLSSCGKSGMVPASAPASAVTASSAMVSDSNGLLVSDTRETIGPDLDDSADAATTPPAAPADPAPVAPTPAAPPETDPPATVATNPPEPTAPPADDGAPPEVATSKTDGFHLPAFEASWGLSRSVYDKGVQEMSDPSRFTNQRYVALVDMNRHSSQRRFFLFDLATGKLERHNVSHGTGSDPKATGYAKLFANVTDSEKTSLGAYKTGGTYRGKHGLQLRLVGLEPTNSHALDRGIVLHGAPYVIDGKKAGRSWGCPAVDQRVVASVIDRLKGGALLLIAD